MGRSAWAGTPLIRRLLPLLAAAIATLKRQGVRFDAHGDRTTPFHRSAATVHRAEAIQLRRAPPAA